MSDSLTIDVDTTELFAALDGIPDAVLRHIKPASKVTADNIANEARRRIRRRAAGPTRRGKHTAEGITVDETTNREGYIVWVKSPAMPNLPLWLAFGTKYMRGDDFLFASARIESGPHDLRMREAVQAAIDEKGLGE